jgi:hypothetical protein
LLLQQHLRTVETGWFSWIDLLVCFYRDVFITACKSKDTGSLENFGDGCGFYRKGAKTQSSFPRRGAQSAKLLFKGCEGNQNKMPLQ